VVAIPALPTELPPPPDEPAKVEQVAVREPRSNVARAYAALDTFTPEQLAELYVWLGERPMPNVDPVRLAHASTNALREDELALFVDGLRKSMDPELWELLTTT